MLRGLRALSPSVFIAVCCAALVARGEGPKNSLRLVSAEEPIVVTDKEAISAAAKVDKEPVVVERTPVTLVVERVEDELGEPPQPPNLGGELALPAPNPYASTAPAEEPSSPYPWPEQPDAQYGHPHHAAPRTPLSDYIRSRPRQQQLQRESWLNRPYSLGFFMGGMFLDSPISGITQGQPGFMYGGRFGWDFGPSFGVETRLLGADPGLHDPASKIDLPTAHVFAWDLNWLWYWTGDTRWRPYFSLGMGLFKMGYLTPAGIQGGKQNNTALEMPFGFGLKYRHSTRLAMRFDVLDNLTFAHGGQDSMNNFSLTAGLEWRYGGGSRRNYWPWNPGHNWR